MDTLPQYRFHHTNMLYGYRLQNADAIKHSRIQTPLILSIRVEFVFNNHFSRCSYLEQFTGAIRVTCLAQGATDFSPCRLEDSNQRGMNTLMEGLTTVKVPTCQLLLRQAICGDFPTKHILELPWVDIVLLV